MTEQQGDHLHDIEERLGMMGVLGVPTEAELTAALACVPGAERPRIEGGRLTYDPPPTRPVPPPLLMGRRGGLFGGRG
jgi:hypothetical protein